MSDSMIKEFLDKILDTKGTIFSCGFIKRTDGTFRKMTARLNVHKNIKGTGMRYSLSEKRLLGVWDMHKRGYRTIPYDNILFLKARGKMTVSVECMNKMDITNRKKYLGEMKSY